MWLYNKRICLCLCVYVPVTAITHGNIEREVLSFDSSCEVI